MQQQSRFSEEARRDFAQMKWSDVELHGVELKLAQTPHDTALLANRSDLIFNQTLLKLAHSSLFCGQIPKSYGGPTTCSTENDFDTIHNDREFLSALAQPILAEIQLMYTLNETNQVDEAISRLPLLLSKIDEFSSQLELRKESIGKEDYKKHVDEIVIQAIMLKLFLSGSNLSVDEKIAHCDEAIALNIPKITQNVAIIKGFALLAKAKQTGDRSQLDSYAASLVSGNVFELKDLPLDLIAKMAQFLEQNHFETTKNAKDVMNKINASIEDIVTLMKNVDTKTLISSPTNDNSPKADQINRLMEKVKPMLSAETYTKLLELKKQIPMDKFAEMIDVLLLNAYEKMVDFGLSTSGVLSSSVDSFKPL